MGTNEQSYGSGGRPRLRRLPEQENRPAGRLGPAVQSSGGSQVEPGGVAVHLDDDRAKMAQAGRLFRDPESIRQSGDARNQEIVREKAGIAGQPGRVGQTGLRQRILRGDPEDRKAGLTFLREQRLAQQSEES